MVRAHSEKEWRIKTALAVLLNKQSWEKKLRNSSAMSQLMEPHDPLEYSFCSKNQENFVENVGTTLSGESSSSAFQMKEGIKETIKCGERENWTRLSSLDKHETFSAASLH